MDVAKALVALSKELNSTVIAEGIETEEELRTLMEVGVKIGQGFLFARPDTLFADIKR